MDYVLLGGAIGILLVIAFSVRSGFKARRVEEKAREDYRRTVERGVQPASLYPRVNPSACIGSGTCIAVCPEKDVLGLIEGKARLVNPTSCIGHGECLRACPVDAITLVLGTERRGVEIPLLQADFQTNVPGLYIIGELGGMGLIYNAMTQALQCMDEIRRAPRSRISGVHELLIVGAGPAGLAASLSALEAEMDFVTVDQESIGGTVLHYPRHKVVMTKSVILPLYGRVKVDTVEKEALLEIWEDIIRRTGLAIETQTTVHKVTRAEDGIFDVSTTRGHRRAQRVILAMGRRGTPRKLEVVGEERSKVTYRLLEPERYAGSRCLVVGGGDAAVEAAVALGDKGARVHLAHRRQFFDRIKPANQAHLDDRVRNRQVNLLLEAAVHEIKEESVVLSVAQKKIELDNDYVIVLIGGVLPTTFLETAGVEVQTFKGQAFAPANR